MNILKTFVYYMAPLWLVNFIQKMRLPAGEAVRFEAFAKWIECAKHIAEHTADPEALKILSFLRHACLVRPVRSGHSPLFLRKGFTFPAVLLLESDVKVGGVWESRFDKDDHVFAAFITYHGLRHGTLLLKDTYQVCDMTMGLGILHEAYHGFAHYKLMQNYGPGDKIPVRTRDNLALEEVETLSFEARLLGLLLGKPYHELVEAAVLEFEPTARRLDWKLEQDLFLPVTAKLQRLFPGGFKSNEEAGFYHNSVMCDVVFRLIDRNFPHHLRNLEKVKFVLSLEGLPIAA